MIDRRDYFAAHAPPVPAGYPTRMVEQVAYSGSGNVIVTVPETSLAREVRWRWEYADAMINGGPAR